MQVYGVGGKTMKITKLKKGYRINLTDTEMSLLRSIHSEGLFAYQEIHDEDLTGLNAPEKRILTEINNGKREWL
jgi:hypothetical protein